MKIAIVDDSKQMCLFLKNIIQNYYKNSLKISIDIFNNGTLLLSSDTCYDLIFLDIELGIDNGIEIAKRLRKRDKTTKIVIISGYQEYKSKAYNIHCFDFLDKPIIRERFIEFLKELDDYLPKNADIRYIILKTNQGITRLQYDDIKYIEYKNRKTTIVTSKQEFTTNITMSELLTKLKSFGFGSPHRATMPIQCKE